MKNRCSCKARLEHEQRFLLINLVLTWETVSILDDNTAQRRGYRECHFTHNLAVWQLIASKSVRQVIASNSKIVVNVSLEVFVTHEIAATEGLWFQIVNGKLMVPNFPVFW